MEVTTRSGATHGTGLEEARARLASARRVVALTGAGISAESGVPTFRGPSAVGEAFPQPRERDSLALERLDGLTTRSRSHQVDALWRQFRPEDLATPRAFARDPGLVWEWYAWRRERIAAVRPNAGHHALARLEQRTPESAQAARAADVVLVVGTSSLVYPAAALPQAGLAAGAFVVEVNPERTPLSESCPVSLRGRAAEVLPQLVGEAA